MGFVLFVVVLCAGAAFASHAAATHATDAVLANHGAVHWKRTAFLAFPWTASASVKGVTWLVTYYQDLDVPNQAFCETTQFTVSLSGRILRTFGDPAGWVACLGGDSSKVRRGA
jgi:hypothetical protein